MIRNDYWVVEHAGSFSGDSSRLAVVGDSGGGTLAAALCLITRDRQGPKIALQVLINPATDLTCGGTLERQNDLLDPLRWFATQYVSTAQDVNLPLVSPLLANDLSKLPSALVLLAEQDPVRESGQKYAERLQAAGVPTEIYCQMGAPHLAGYGARAAPLAQESLHVACQALQRAFAKT
jgi:acetyl esterase